MFYSVNCQYKFKKILSTQEGYSPLHLKTVFPQHRVARQNVGDVKM